MKLINKTGGYVVSNKASLAESLISRMRGLMLSDKKDLVLVSPREDVKSSAIHMLLMKYPIDIVWLNSSKKVVDRKRDIPPLNPLKPKTWRIYKPREKAKYVIELSNGGLGDTEVGDEIVFDG